MDGWMDKKQAQVAAAAVLLLLPCTN